MEKPRITLLHYTAPPIIGGVENVIAQHVQLFANAGYPVTLVTGRGGADAMLADVRTVLIPEIDSEHSENLALTKQIQVGVIPPQFDDFQHRIERALEPILTDSDVVIAHNIFNYHFNLPLTVAMHRLLDQGVIRQMMVWCHDISRYVNPPSGAILRYGFPWDLLRCWRIDVTYVTVSAQRRAALAQVLGCSEEQIRVVPNGVDTTVLFGLSDLGRHLVDEFDLLDADLIILMPIRITRAKNIEFALEVTASLVAAGINPRLIVTGPPDPHQPDIVDYFSALRQQRRRLALEGQAIFVFEGTSKFTSPLTLNSAQVAELYRLSDLVFTPSHREGFGLPVLEGGLVGKPVFATAIPALDEIGKDAIYLIAPEESPAQVAARIRRWAQHDLTHRLSQHVRQRYTWQTLFARSIEPLLANSNFGGS